MLVVAKLFGEIFRRMKQPALVGELLAGIVLGPSLFGFFHPDEMFSIFKGLAVFFLMFLAGMEMNLNEIKKASKKAVVISLAAFFVPFFAGYQVGILFGLEQIQSLFIGLLLSITAIPVSAIILMEFGMLKSKIGNTVITAAVINDILALLVLAIILQMPSGESTLEISSIGISVLKISLFFVAIGVLGVILSKKDSAVSKKLDKFVSRLRTKEAGFGILLICAISVSLFAHYSDLHFIIGAFFAGLIFGKSFNQGHDEKASKLVSGFTFGLFAPIFFVLIGMEFNMLSLSDSIPLFVTLLGVAIVAKLGSAYLAARATRFSHNEGLVIGSLMNGRGMVELAIASIGFTAGILDIKLFSVAIAIGFLTTILTPLITKPFVEKLKESKEEKLGLDIKNLNEKYHPSRFTKTSDMLESKLNQDQVKNQNWDKPIVKNHE